MQVASWGAYLMSRNITTMSFAPRDNHEAQVQFALERGVPAMIGVIASKRLPYPSRAFDMAHCSRCLIPWHKYGNWGFKISTYQFIKLLSWPAQINYIFLFIWNRWGLFDWSGSGSETRRVLDSIGSSDPVEEILERVGKNQEGFKWRTDKHWESSKEPVLEKVCRKRRYCGLAKALESF